MEKLTKHTLHVHGMHCSSCVVLTENELKAHPKVASAKSDLGSRSVEICGDFGDLSLDEIAKELTQILSQHQLSTEKQKTTAHWSDFKWAVPIALGFIALFLLLQKIGIVNLVNAGKVTFGTAFVVGIVASLSTCMAVVGGLLLSMSATFAREASATRSHARPEGFRGDEVKPQVLFHVGRIVSFFILGGVIGLVGSAFQLGSVSTFILGLIIGLVMLVLGVNLLDVFPWAKKLQPAMPKFLAHKALNASKLNHTLTPALVGIATFFLPCGFTQSMQIYTLSTGSFWSGGLTMLMFALGTLPVLALVSFSSFSIQNHAKAGIFFKSAGLIVIIFALFNIINSLVAIGWLAPIFNF